MKAIITPKYYFEQSLFSQEQKKIFHDSWVCVGLTSELSDNNDFLTTVIADIPVVLQNMKGQIKAFQNVCSHRFSIIQTEPKGNRPMVCPYHGWSYNEEGLPLGIPKKPLFEFSKEELHCLKLVEYSVATCGNLLFVKLANNDVTLEDYLGNFYAYIEEVSNSFGRLVDVNEMKIEANWKIVVENTLESYHVNLIHTDTFRKLGTSGLDFQFSKSHSLWSTDLKYAEDDKAVQVVHKPYKNRPFKINGYNHLLIFPNVLLSTTYGISFNISFVTPVSEAVSNFKSYVFTTRKNEEKKTSAVEEAYENSLKDFNRKVFAEDKFICEKVQIGVRSAPYSGELSEEEMRVCKFQQSYYNLLTQNESLH